MNNNIFTIVIDEIKLNEKSRNDISELIDKILFYQKKRKYINVI